MKSLSRSTIFFQENALKHEQTKNAVLLLVTPNSIWKLACKLEKIITTEGSPLLFGNALESSKNTFKFYSALIFTKIRFDNTLTRIFLMKWIFTGNGTTLFWLFWNFCFFHNWVFRSFDDHFMNKFCQILEYFYISKQRKTWSWYAKLNILTQQYKTQ